MWIQSLKDNINEDIVPCYWKMRASYKESLGVWQMGMWVDNHNCMAATSANDNDNVTSSFISGLILRKIEIDIGYTVKAIQGDVKTFLGVDVKYKKAWHARRKAVDQIYGDWSSNFDDLPRYDT